MISVWRAEPHEAEVVARLVVEFRDHLGLDWPSANAFLAGVERLIEERDTAFLLGTPHEDAPPCGVAQVRFRYGLWWAAQDCLLEDLFVREDARNSGVGRALVQGTIDLARERGCRRVELDVNEANAPALAVYESFGFSAQDDRYGGRNLLMRLRLEDGP
ncbi:MAG TPA: GNAT family N-acetyltransferase [Solirubrobacteraceae bacterium]|nr:GNAT family N-acetyltransferase [Solirubrobacteraceae bacterium]